jgi:four helix bundle protein
MSGPLRVRTRAFAIDVLRFVETLPRTEMGRIVARQLGRAGSSVGANYRRTRLAQSSRDYVAKLKLVEEESDESEFWLEICAELQLGGASHAARLLREAGEITSMVVSSIKTVRRNNPAR